MFRAGGPSRGHEAAPQGASVQAGEAGELSDSHTVGGEGDHCTREEASVEEGRASRGAAWGLGDLRGQSTDVNNLCGEKQQQSPTLGCQL